MQPFSRRSKVKHKKILSFPVVQMCHSLINNWDGMWPWEHYLPSENLFHCPWNTQFMKYERIYFTGLWSPTNTMPGTWNVFSVSSLFLFPTWLVLHINQLCTRNWWQKMKNMSPYFSRASSEPDLQMNAPKVLSTIIKIHRKCHKMIIKVPRICQNTYWPWSYFLLKLVSQFLHVCVC